MLQFDDCKNINLFVRKTRTKIFEFYKYFISIEEMKVVNEYMNNVPLLSDPEKFVHFKNQLKIFEER